MSKSTSPYAVRTRRGWWLILGLVGLLVIAARAGEANQAPVTAVLGAMPEEVRLLESHLQGKHTTEQLGIKFYTGTLAGRSVVLAYTGVGKVNAAMTTTLVLDHYHPAELLFTGVAGGVNTNLGPGDIVLGAQVVQHDFGEITDQGVHTQPTPIRSREKPIRSILQPRTGCWDWPRPRPRVSRGRRCSPRKAGARPGSSAV